MEYRRVIISKQADIIGEQKVCIQDFAELLQDFKFRGNYEAREVLSRHKELIESIKELK